MPERFVLMFQTGDGTWMEEAQCAAGEFQRLEDGGFVCSSGGSATWIRCVERHDAHFVHVDGGGDRHRYRLVPLPSLPAPDQ